jgi:hypothetical protein
MIPLSILSIFLSRDGLGKDIWTVPFDQITDILHIYYFEEMMYITSLGLTRVSILLLYVRLFSTGAFRSYAYALIGFHLVYIAAFDIPFLLQCRPINLAWNWWDGEHEGVCLNINAIGWSAAGVNIGLDLVTIMLPMPRLAKLKLSWHKKVPVVLIFLLGLL